VITEDLVAAKTKKSTKKGKRARRNRGTTDPFARAFESVARVMRDGATKHPDNDWVRRTPDYHFARAEEHLRLLREGDQRQDHLSHATTRLLMALALRELS
jgi:dATP/dGTP diphosphohydrolase